jgi:hypothetical protein
MSDSSKWTIGLVGYGEVDRILAQRRKMMELHT